jgi:hypothetical protein
MKNDIMNKGLVLTRRFFDSPEEGGDLRVQRIKAPLAYDTGKLFFWPGMPFLSVSLPKFFSHCKPDKLAQSRRQLSITRRRQFRFVGAPCKLPSSFSSATDSVFCL